MGFPTNIVDFWIAIGAIMAIGMIAAGVIDKNKIEGIKTIKAGAGIISVIVFFMFLMWVARKYTIEFIIALAATVLITIIFRK